VTALNYQQHGARVLGPRLPQPSRARRDAVRGAPPAHGESARDAVAAHSDRRGLAVDPATTPARLQADRPAAENHYHRGRGFVSLSPACYTQEEIAARENLTQPAVGLVSKEFAEPQKLLKSQQSAAEHATDFDPPRRAVASSAGSPASFPALTLVSTLENHISTQDRVTPSSSATRSCVQDAPAPPDVPTRHLEPAARATANGAQGQWHVAGPADGPGGPPPVRVVDYLQIRRADQRWPPVSKRVGIFSSAFCKMPVFSEVS
jgi:hypothetical protein